MCTFFLKISNKVLKHDNLRFGQLKNIKKFQPVILLIRFFIFLFKRIIRKFLILFCYLFVVFIPWTNNKCVIHLPNICSKYCASTHKTRLCQFRCFLFIDLFLTPWHYLYLWWSLLANVNLLINKNFSLGVTFSRQCKLCF